MAHAHHKANSSIITPAKQETSYIADALSPAAYWGFSWGLRAARREENHKGCIYIGLCARATTYWRFRGLNNWYSTNSQLNRQLFLLKRLRSDSFSSVTHMNASSYLYSELASFWILHSFVPVWASICSLKWCCIVHRVDNKTTDRGPLWQNRHTAWAQTRTLNCITTLLVVCYHRYYSWLLLLLILWLPLLWCFWWWRLLSFRSLWWVVLWIRK